MDNIATPVEALFEKAENYSKTSLELFKLTAIDKCADLVSSIAVQFAIFIVAAVFTLVINIGIAMWLGDLLGKMYLGFFAVAIFYAIVIALLYFFRHQWIKTPVSNSVIAQMTK